MTIDEFNRLDPVEATQLLSTCADIKEWVSQLIASRPFPTRQALLDAAGQAAAGWSSEDVAAALAQHPRIGERPDVAKLGSANSAHSSREQAGMATAALDVQAAIAAGNVAYEKRFGRVFLIRAAGRSPEEILAALTERLHNDAATEGTVVAGQLGEIALLRLGQAVAA